MSILFSWSSRLKVMTEKSKSLEWSHSVLQQRYDQIFNDRNTLKSTFSTALYAIDKKTSLKTTIMTKKIANLKEVLESKDIMEKIELVATDPEERVMIKDEIGRVMNEKNLEIKRLQLELSRFQKVWVE